MSVCDKVYIYDQGSTDGSHAVYLREGYHVIVSETNRFYEEMACKEELLQWIIKREPDTNWILWIDGDTMLDKRLWDRDTMEDLLKIPGQHDHLRFHHYNLWRSDTYYRTDNRFHCLSHNVAPLWRFNKDLHFPGGKGLHIDNQPAPLYSARCVDYALIHRGFATDEALIRRFDRNFSCYIDNDESPWITMRSIDEMGLAVNRIPNPEEILPESLCVRDINPRALKQLIFLYTADIERIAGMSLQEVYRQHSKKWHL